MKKKNTILLLGIAAIFLMIAVQLFILKEVWQQKNEMFDLRYRLLSQEAITWLGRRWSSNGFDTASLIINRYTEKVIQEALPEIKNDTLFSGKKKDVYEFINQVLSKEQDLSQFLSSYFERQGFEKEFNHVIVINSLDIINSDERIPIFKSEEFSGEPKRQKSKISIDQSKLASRILVNRYFMEDNHYQLFFNYYIDFSDKQKLVMKEVLASFLLSAISIIAVTILFMITYRNLIEEKRLSNLKTDFINNMTHELKTPLSTITIAGKTLEIEQIRNDESKILETARLIGKQSVLLNQLINMILDISMWERTQFQLDRKRVRIDDVMNDIVDSFRKGYGNHTCLNQKFNFGDTLVDLDILYFTTLINNLLSNAVKYSENEPVIDIEGYTKNKNVFIRISDNGIGITKNDQKHIFEKFYRASTGNIHRFKGLGLGLYYVKKIAEAHGGDVTVTSNPGKGSIFTVTLPYL